jgi:ubiquinone/menaquinone biosynthesis C-methylase UbiE
VSTFKDHFSGGSKGYAAHRPGYPKAVAEALAGCAPGRDRAWDAGCGSGQLSTVLGDVFQEVLATDASAQQIAAAVPHPHVRYAVSPAERVDLPDRSVDCAVAAQAAHWFDLDAYYREVRRVLRPGGVIALVTYALMHITPEIDALVYRFYRGPLDPYWPPERRLVEEGYRSVPFPFTEVTPPPLELLQRWSADEVVGYIGTWSAVQGLKKAGKGAELEAMVVELQRAWGDPAIIQDVRWPLVHSQDLADLYALEHAPPQSS